MPRKDTSKQKWIETGYEHFALYGPDNISINAISKEIKSPRASFYHHFSDLEVFTEILLEKHIELVGEFIREGKESCRRLLPDFYQLLEQFALGLKFNRQLFINRHVPLYGYVFAKVYEKTCNEFVFDLFVKQYDLKLKHEDVSRIWLTFTESWYTRIDPERFTADEMQTIAESIMSSILKFLSSDLFEVL